MNNTRIPNIRATSESGTASPAAVEIK